MAEQTVTRFDIDNLDTNAVRALAIKRRELDDAIAKRETKARMEGEAMTIAGLKAEVGQMPVGAPNRPSTKDDWVALYVAKVSQDTLYAKELKRLTKEAHRDERIAATLNGMLDAADEADEALRTLVNGSGGRLLVSKLRWESDSHMIIQATAMWARRVLAEVQKGQDLRDAVLTLLGNAMERLFELPSAVLANGLAGTLKAEYLHEAVAAERFRSKMVMCFDRNMPITIDLIKGC
jgi:DNA primase